MLIAGGALAWAHPSVWGWPAAVLLALFFLAFAIQEPLRAVVARRRGDWWRWILGYGSLLLAGASWLVVEHDLYLLLPAAGLGVLLTVGDLIARRFGLHRALIVRMAGGGVLTLVLPGTLCMLHPTMHAYAFVLWALTVAYFVTRLLFVRERLCAARDKPQPALRHASRLSHLVTYAGVGTLVATGLAGPLAFAAFVPATIQSLRPTPPTTARRIGLAEVALLAWFVVVLVLSFHALGFTPA